MALQPGILDTSIIGKGAQSKIDLATPVNIYTSLQANKRANQQAKDRRALADLELTKEQAETKRQAKIKTILGNSLNENGSVNGMKAISALNQEGEFEYARTIEDRMVKAQDAQRKRTQFAQNDLGTSFRSALDTDNQVEGFLLAREDAIKKGYPLSEGLKNYMPTDEEIINNQLDPRVRTEMEYISDKYKPTDKKMSLEDKLYLLRQRYKEKGELVEKKADIKSEAPLTKAEESRERIAKAKVDIAEKTLKLKEKKSEREEAKWELTKEKALEAHKVSRLKHKSNIDKFSRFTRKARKIAKSPNLKYITGLGRYHLTKGKDIPEAATVGKDLQADLNNLLAMGAINTMIQLKAESKTGSTGFGALSASELTILKNALGSFEDDEVTPKKKAELLIEVADIIDDYQDRIEEFDTEYSEDLGTDMTEEDILNKEIDGL